MSKSTVSKKEQTPEVLSQAKSAVTSPAPKPKRMSISLPADSVEQLDYLVAKQGISQNETIRKAIATETYIQKAKEEGSSILVRKSDNSMMEVVFR